MIKKKAASRTRLHSMEIVVEQNNKVKVGSFQSLNDYLLNTYLFFK